MIRVQRSHVNRKGRVTQKLEDIYCSCPLDALHHLVEVDLSLGGILMPMDNGKIQVRTEVTNGAVVSVYRGPESEMRVIRNFIYFRNQYAGQMTELIDGVEVLRDERMKCVHPRVENLILSDAHRTGIATLLACDINHPDDVHAHYRHKPSDIIGAVQLIREGHISSLTEALAVA